MIKDNDPKTAERQVKLALLLLLHSPNPIELNKLSHVVDARVDTVRHDLNWISDFLNPYDLVVDPTVDQQVKVYGRENNIFRASLDLLITQSGPDTVTTQFSISDPTLETQLMDRLNRLVQTIPLDVSAQQAIYNYMWTLGMRYRFGTVKRAALATMFTPGQLALISREKELHHWSQHTVEVLESDLPEGHDMPLIEGYLLTLRIWLYSH